VHRFILFDVRSSPTDIALFRSPQSLLLPPNPEACVYSLSRRSKSCSSHIIPSPFSHLPTLLLSSHCIHDFLKLRTDKLFMPFTMHHHSMSATSSSRVFPWVRSDSVSPNVSSTAFLVDKLYLAASVSRSHLNLLCWSRGSQ